MSRPPEHKLLTRKHHVMTWQNASRRTRGLYAQQRGQFVQAQISGYSYRTRTFIFQTWDYMAWKAAFISMHWGGVWTPAGLKARALIEKAAP